MRYVTAILAIAIGIVTVGYFALRLLAGSDLVSDHYPTMQSARDDMLFRRGWLPEIIPESSRDIETNNYLETNTSWGEFSFDPTDYREFLSHTEPVLDTIDQYPLWLDEISHAQSRGQDVVVHVEYGNTWLFICDPDKGNCEYRLRPTEG